MLHAYGEPAPHLVYVPETHFSAERFLHDVEQEMAKHKAVIVAVSEGVSVPEGVQSGWWTTSGISTCLASASTWNSWCVIPSDVRCVLWN